ncbi:hypothetical protein F511_15313 [Dorcoceras hygrometricum]|uniref:F-box associated domain-containing protein n=1 Tax=Dorcoceras hygrometricum TaxID=472368 RepID=A0A2Z7BYV1_9LAMI|nr:hypothetical protein F511_15313 [Dorcoceras hygrometricum]
MRGGSLVIWKLDFGFEHLVRNICNGTVLGPEDCGEQHILYVTNPLTKQRATLPPFHGGKGCHSELTLAFAESSLECKVVHTLATGPFDIKPRVAVLTLGVDKVWRHIDIQHLSLKRMEAPGMCSPLVTGGYIHWIIRFGCVLTLNVETETIRQFPMHPRLLRGRGSVKYLPMGRYLTILHESSMFLMDVWEMNPETGEWTMSLSFDLSPLNDRFHDLFGDNSWHRSMSPSGWLGADRKVLLLTSWCTKKICVAYNLETGEIQSLELESALEPHLNNLLRLERGFRVRRQGKRQGIPLSCT